MSQLIENLQYRLKESSTSIALISFRLLSGVFIGLTLALIFEEIIKYGVLAFTMVIVVSTMSFMRISRGWNFVGVLVFNLICVLLGLLLHLYILMAPGA